MAARKCPPVVAPTWSTQLPAAREAARRRRVNAVIRAAAISERLLTLGREIMRRHETYGFPASRELCDPLVEIVEDVERTFYGMSPQRHARVAFLETLDEVTSTGEPLDLNDPFEETEVFSARRLFASHYRDLAVLLDAETLARALDAWLKTATEKPSKWEVLAQIFATTWDREPLKGPELTRAGKSLKRDWQKWNAGLRDRWMQMRTLSVDVQRNS